MRTAWANALTTVSASVAMSERCQASLLDQLHRSLRCASGTPLSPDASRSSCATGKWGTTVQKACQSGVPARELAERAGHSKPSMSLDIYTHVMPVDEVSVERFLSLLVVA